MRLWYRVAMWIGYYWILSIYILKNYEFPDGKNVWNNGTFYEIQTYRNSSHGSLPQLEVTLHDN